jgi:hypothetical protein
MPGVQGWRVLGLPVLRAAVLGLPAWLVQVQVQVMCPPAVQVLGLPAGVVQVMCPPAVRVLGLPAGMVLVLGSLAGLDQVLGLPAARVLTLPEREALVPESLVLPPDAVWAPRWWAGPIHHPELQRTGCPCRMRRTGRLAAAPAPLPAGSG